MPNKSDIHIMNRYEPLHVLERERDFYVAEMFRFMSNGLGPGEKCYDVAMKRKKDFDFAILLIKQMAQL